MLNTNTKVSNLCMMFKTNKISEIHGLREDGTRGMLCRRDVEILSVAKIFPQREK